MEQIIRIARNKITLETTPLKEETLKLETFQPKGLPGITIEVVVDEEGCMPTKSKPIKDHLQLAAVYKSLLQKAVRRMNLKEGIKAFDWLWVNDRTSLLRRITIISLEDGFYNPTWNSFWIWLLLLDSRGYAFNDSIRIEMRKQVGELILHPLYSRIKEVNSVRNLDYMRNLDLVPLVIRKEYGGMPGDMRMIQNFLETYRPNPELQRLPLMHPTTEAEIFEACDFHVFPWLAKTDAQRVMFWECRSRINLRDRSTMSRAFESNQALKDYDHFCRNLYQSMVGSQ